MFDLTNLLSTAKDAGELISRLKGKLLRQPDGAARKMAEVLGELSKIFVFVEGEIVRFLSVYVLPDRGNIIDCRSTLLAVEGGLVAVQSDEARGHCHKIENIYNKHPQRWFHARGRSHASACPVKKSMRATERNNYKRGWFRRRVRSLNKRRFVFVDESAVNTAMTQRYGRAPCGERAHDSAPRNYGAHTSLIGAMGLRVVVAALTVEGAVDTEVFNVYAEQVLGPRLRRGDVVVLDNLGAHRASRIEEVATMRGAQVLWLPPYSPIEQCWSKIKSYLRGAKARTHEHLEKVLAAALGLVTRANIRGWFKRCGYSLARE
jgi:transposase